jgi:hypothetical protein
MSGKLDVTPPAVAGSRPATDQSVQGTHPQPMKPFPALAELRMSPKSANEFLDDPRMSLLCFEPRPPRPCGPGLPGLAPVIARGPGARPPTPSDPHRSASPPIPIPTQARTSALGGYVTGHGIGSGGSAAGCARRWHGGNGRVPYVRVRSASRVHLAAAHQGGLLVGLAPGRHVEVGRLLAGTGRRPVDVTATLKALTWDLSAALC